MVWRERAVLTKKQFRKKQISNSEFYGSQRRMLPIYAAKLATPALPGNT